MDVSSLIGILLIVAGFLFVIGLIRPGFVVFWSDKKSRSSVLTVWGAAVVVLIIAYWVSHSGDNDPFKQGNTKKAAQNVWRG